MRRGGCSGVRSARKGDLGDATRTTRDPEPEAVKLDDGPDQAEAKPHALGLSALLRSIEAPEHDVALVLADARSGVADAHETFAVAVDHSELNPAAFGREFHGVIDE